MYTLSANNDDLRILCPIFNFYATVTWLMAAGAIFTVLQRRKVANGQQNRYYLAYNVNQINMRV